MSRCRLLQLPSNGYRMTGLPEGALAYLLLGHLGHASLCPMQDFLQVKGGHGPSGPIR